MQTKVDSILASVNSTKESYNILTFATHEAYQTNLKNLPHKFYMATSDGVKRWDNSYRTIPENHLEISEYTIRNNPHIKFDMVLSQSKFGQFQSMKNIADQFNCPHIHIEHVWPMPDMHTNQFESFRSMKADYNLFITQESMNAWGFTSDSKTRVLTHGIDTNLFNNNSANRTKTILTVVNDYINRGSFLGFGMYQRLTKDLPVTRLGKTAGFSEAARSIYQLILNYKTAGVFLNTSLYSPIPMSLLEAASCGCPIVTTMNCGIGNLIEDGINGFASNDEAYLREKLIWCLDNPEEAKAIGDKARQTVINKFGIKQHISQWENLLKEAYGSNHRS